MTGAKDRNLSTITRAVVEETRVDFGANIFGVGALADPGTLADVARLAEDLGYHSVFVADHIVVPRKFGSKYPYSRDGWYEKDPDVTRIR
jgi:alkanesulfonate monooxygenase SsuD/methylene tetrahydromethanopterin reductase-like flavin-dependent oxidoreductase (luciferase family)